MGIRGAAAQGSPEARQACTPDAMRLSSDFISDVTQTTKCMMAKRAQLSPECGPRWRTDTGRTTGRIGTTDIARTADTAADFLSEPSKITAG